MAADGAGPDSGGGGEADSTRFGRNGMRRAGAIRLRAFERSLR